MSVETFKPFSKVGGLSFNIYTGKTKFFADWVLREEGVSTGDWIKIRSSPKHDCKKCYGRGYIGRYQKRYIPCRCLFRIK